MGTMAGAQESRMRSYVRNRSLMGSSDGPHLATRTNNSGNSVNSISLKSRFVVRIYLLYPYYVSHIL